MKLSAYVFLIVSLVSAGAGAQEVPAIGSDGGTPPNGIVASTSNASRPAPTLAVGEPIVLGTVPKLSAKEQEAVRLASKFRAQPDRTTLGENGRVTYLYGSSVPTIVCAPLFVCALELQPGEIVNDLSLGAQGLWKVGMVTSGAGANVTTLVTVKPVGYGSSFTTNLMVATDRRSYILQLTAHPSNWMARVSFAYPEDAGVDLAEYRRRIASQQATTAQSVTVQSYQSFDFGYKVSGRTRFKPTRVYTDGLKTIVEFPSALSTTDAPALLSIGPDGKEELVNYRQAGNLYIVDLVMDKGVLVSGTGRKQQRVSFTRTGG